MPGRKRLAVGDGEYADAVAIAGAELSTVNGEIANGAKVSGAIDCGVGQVPGRIDIPALNGDYTLTFDVSTDGLTWKSLVDENGEISFSDLDEDQSLVLKPSTWATVRYFRIKVPTDQTASRTFVITTRAV
ncbi:MAG: hypothetical protein JXB35_10385 [Anaerolineae bacterium]|nr:hypothetical protein [Anaerolineae bacterium]